MELSRRDFLNAAPLAAMQTRRAKPNILFILADDLGCYDVGCYGQKLIRTPNIDRLAREGMRFTQCYCGATVCAPSRNTLMTGQHLGHTTVRDNHSLRTGERVPLRAEDVTVAEVLKGAGYRTGIIGKWGLGEPGTTGVPNRQGFDEWFGFLNQDHAIEYYTDYLWRNDRKEIIRANRDGKKGAYVHDLFTEDAVRFLRAHRTEPFFLYLAYTIPHADHVVPGNEPYARQPWTEEQKNYAAMVTRMDRDIGRLMALLKETGLDENTIVFFSSDNGAGFGEGVPLFHSTGPLRERKGSVYEGGIRAPMIVRRPGSIQAGAASDYVWAFWDFLPTAAELAGVPAPSGIDGISVLPVLQGRKPVREREYLYWESFRRKELHQALRIGPWKGVRHGLSKPLELYDLSHDEGERNNIAAAHRDIVTRMERILKTVRTENPEYPVPSEA